MREEKIKYEKQMEKMAGFMHGSDILYLDAPGLCGDTVS